MEGFFYFLSFPRNLDQFCRQHSIKREILLRKCIFGYFFETFGAWCIKNKQMSQKSENFAILSLMLKYYFPFYKKKCCFSARTLFFPYSQPLEVPRKIGFGGVLLKQSSGKNARKPVKTGPKNGPDIFTHAHMYHRAAKG